MIGMAVLFIAFVACVVLGVWALLRSDTNTPDTELSLIVARMTVNMRGVERAIADALTPAIRQMSEAFKGVAAAMQLAAPTVSAVLRADHDLNEGNT